MTTSVVDVVDAVCEVSMNYYRPIPVTIDQISAHGFTSALKRLCDEI